MAPLGVSRQVILAGGKRSGLSASTAGESAQQILEDFPNSTDGVYWIDLPTVGPTQVYCIMDSNHNNGGWMMALKATRGTTFGYNSSYWTTNNTLNPTALNRNDGDAKFNVYNYFPAVDLLAIFPDIGQGGSYSYGGDWVWLENGIYNGAQSSTTTTLLNLFSGPEYFIQDAKQFSGYGNAWSSQSDVRFYGYNYRSNNDTKSRWGFGWNENGGGLWPNGDEGSNDVGGGIGMRYRGSYNYSAGDVIGCCQDSSGINRSARVEIYVR
jgi:hypothetical protein